MDFLLNEVTFIFAIVLFLVLGIFLAAKNKTLSGNLKIVIILIMAVLAIYILFLIYLIFMFDSSPKTEPIPTNMKIGL